MTVGEGLLTERVLLGVAERSCWGELEFVFEELALGSSLEVSERSEVLLGSEMSFVERSLWLEVSFVEDSLGSEGLLVSEGSDCWD